MIKSRLINRCSAVVSLLILLFVTSCDNIENKLIPQEEGSIVQTDAHGRTVYTCAMELDGSLMGFDGTSKSGVSTRATESWNDGDVIYLVFYSGSDKVEGKGVYSIDNDKWTLYYYGQLAETDSSYCVAHFFDGSVTPNKAETALTIPSTTAVYGSTEASYSKEGRLVSVKATLAPLTGRILFNGTTGYDFTLSGFKYYHSYSLTNGTLTTTNLEADISVNGNGQSSYVYGLFFADMPHKLTVSTPDYIFETTCEDDVLTTASTGIMTAPTIDYYNGWDCTIIKFGSKAIETVEVNGVSFEMIRVEAGTFRMGADGNWNYGDHQVTLTNDYYMGKTEVTQALWEAVMGSNPSSYKGANNPVENVSWDDCQIFIANLNTLTGLSFRLPSEAEWEYAARGGNKSKGYSYSGSNNIDDVAWYADNSYDYLYGYQSHHQVATKAPNELGLYDMNGNVFEWCQDWYDDYSNSSQIDPKGPNSGSERVIRGGAWGSSAEGCTNVYREHFDPGGRHDCFGLRLCISPFSLCL